MDPSDLLALASRLAVEAGTLIRERRADGLSGVETKSSLTDMVTDHDRASEALIVAGIRAARPSDAIVGEEGTDRPGTSGVEWLIDPIDGTTNYLYALPAYAVSIAAADGDGALVGVVHIPSLGETFTAQRGGGAHCNGVPIRCTDKADAATALLATGFAYDASVRTAQAAVLAAILGRVRDVRRSGSAAADLCWVASGRVDAYYERGLGPWDLAAGELIAREAGARTGDFAGGPPRPGEVLAANPVLFEELSEMLRAAEA